MRGHVDDQGEFVYNFQLEDRVAPDHPLRSIKVHADAVLKSLYDDFDGLYSTTGRPSIPPEQLLKGCLLIALFSVRSDRMFCEMLNYNLLFRWFLDMSLDDKGLDQSNFSRLRSRLEDTDVAKKFFDAVVNRARDKGLLSSEHFTVDGTLLEAWASQKSFRRKDGSDEAPGPDGMANFRGQRRKNDTHQSTTDPEAKLMRKGRGKEAKLCFGGHAMMENRNGFLVDLLVTDATLHETEAAKEILEQLKQAGICPRTLAGDKGYHTRSFVEYLRQNGIRPHIACVAGRRTPGLDGRTTRHEGYKLSQQVRKRVEEIFGWVKTYGGLRKCRFIGTRRNQLSAYLAGAAYNLLRLSRFSAPM